MGAVRHLASTAPAGATVEAKVIDFGLARAATDAADQLEPRHSGFIGTPAFASPEQFTGGTIDARSDIYALGVTLWFCLTGRLPFTGRTMDDIHRQQAGGALPLEQLRSRAVPPAVVDLIRACVAYDPRERPAS
ncbi:MAG: protein kinase, partial [Chthoniobacterales bacterium]|nr:protein kinase [Chthoniobacterales bacterium]